MSDWGDEDETGCGFGSNVDKYKADGNGNTNDNGDVGDEYSNGNDGADGGNFGGRRGFGGGRGGRGGGRGGYGGSSRYNDNENGDGAYEEMGNRQHFGFVPRDFKRSTVEKFLLEVPEYLKNGSLLEIYNILRYVLRAYEIYILAELESEDVKMAKKWAKKQKKILLQSVRSNIDGGATEEFFRNFNMFSCNQADDSVIHEMGTEGDVTDEHVNGTVHYEVATLELAQLLATDAHDHEAIPPILCETKESAVGKIFNEPQVTPCKQRRYANVEEGTIGISRQATRTIPKVHGTVNVPAETVSQTPITRYITEEELQLRKRMPRRNFDSIAAEPERVHNLQISSYCFFNLDVTLLEIEDTAVAKVAVVAGKQSSDTQTTAAENGSITIVPVAIAAQERATNDSNITQISSINVARHHGISVSTSALVAPQPQMLLSQHSSIHMQPILQGSANSNSDFLNYFDERLDSSSAFWRGAHEEDKDVATGGTIVQTKIETPLYTPENFPMFVPDSQSDGKLKNMLTISGASMSAPYAGSLHPKASTLPSIREEKFHRTLLQRSVHDTNLESTPLRGFDKLPLPKSSSIVQDNSNVDGTVESDAGAIENAILVSKSGQIVPGEGKELAVVGSLKDITELQENISDTQSKKNVSVAVTMLTQPDEYSRDWYEVLRTRDIDLKYVNGYSTKAKRRKKVHRKATNTMALPPQTEDDIHMEDLVDVLPPPPESLQRKSHLNTSSQVKTIAEVGLNKEFSCAQTQIISNNGRVDLENILLRSQEEHNHFLVENVESITTIVDNLAKWHHMLTEYKRSYLTAAASGGSSEVLFDSLLAATYTYEFDILLQADRRRLQVKLSLLQEIIRNVTFDLTKLQTLKNRMEIAIAYSFLLELKSANIIRLSSNDYNGQSERNGGFRGRGGRGGGGRGRGGRGGNRNGFNDRNGDGGDGDNNFKGEGESEQKPREFYIPPEPTDNEDEIFNSGISTGINFSKYDSIPVQISGENVPPPIKSFDEAGLREIVMNNVRKSGYKVPTPIQKTAIPVVMAGRDLMACAQTGSGKTAAYLLPIINGILAESCDLAIGKPQAVIVSPTRELAIQIFNEARKFSLGSYLRISIVYGGTSSKHQGENIAKGCHVLICTPGRLLDFVEKGFITFEETRYIVLDEADRMMDMGFKDNVHTIMNHTTMRAVEQRQTLMFSATFPEEIQRLAGEYLCDYVFITIGVVGGACSDVTQSIFEVKKFQKRSKLMELLAESSDGTIVFVETKRGADFLASLLSETEFPTTSIHGDRLQRQREMALADFKSGKMKVLIATSVAARGLDIKNVNHVVNYDMPSSIDEYVHRIGRTGRVGNNGRATSFFDPDHDSAIASDLVKILEGAGQEVPEFLRTYASSGGGGYSQNKFGGRDVRKDVQSDHNYITSAGPGALEEEEDWG